MKQWPSRKNNQQDIVTSSCNSKLAFVMMHIPSKIRNLLTQWLKLMIPLFLLGVAKSNVEAVERARESQAKTQVVGFVPPLMDGEQQQLKLRCDWEKFDTTLQTTILMSIKGNSESWRGLSDMAPAVLEKLLDVKDLTVLSLFTKMNFPS